MTLFPVIRDWITEFLDENKDMTHIQIGMNMLIEQVNMFQNTIYISALINTIKYYYPYFSQPKEKVF